MPICPATNWLCFFRLTAEFAETAERKDNALLLKSSADSAFSAVKHKLGLFFQITVNYEEHEIYENWPRPVIASTAKQSQTFRWHYVYWGRGRLPRPIGPRNDVLLLFISKYIHFPL